MCAKAGLFIILIASTQNFSISDNLSTLTSSIAMVILPKNIKNVTKSESIDIASTLYKKANFFPVHEEVNSSSSVMTVVGSAVISVIVGGIPDGTKLIDPVTIILALNIEVRLSVIRVFYKLLFTECYKSSLCLLELYWSR